MANSLKLFISHNGEGDEEYLTFIQRLLEAPDFEWEALGNPGENSPAELETHIKNSQVVIILSGLYKKQPQLVEKQLKLAKKYQKPIVAIKPYGLEEVPIQIEKAAKGVVGWNRVCIVETIEESLEMD